MDLIYTDASREDIGALQAYALDLSFGAKENDFEITLSADFLLEYGAFIYIEGTEYGGIVDGLKTKTDSETITYIGRTWHGLINSKVIEPDAGAAYLKVSGDANEVIGFVLDRLGLGDLFEASEEESGITVNNYQFARYCFGYDGLIAMLTANNAKLHIAWENRKVRLSAVPIVDYANAPLDDDTAKLQIEKHDKKVNHIICLGKGELTEREVHHFYIDQFGQVSTAQYYTGIDEYTAIYENTNAEDTEELTDGGKARLRELQRIDKADISVPEIEGNPYDIGDIVGASNIKTGISVASAVSQKIVRIQNGVIDIEYQTGG